MPSYLKPTTVGALIALALLLTNTKAFAQNAKSSEVQAWYSDNGTKIDAKYLGFKDGKVQLQKADGQQLDVPLTKLSLSGQLRVKKIIDPKAFDAPPLPSSFAPPPISDSPFPSDPTIEQYLEIYYTQLKAGKADVEWHALPPNIKADIEAIVVKGAEVLGPRTFKQLQAVLPNVLTIIHDKRTFIVGIPAIARQPEVAKMVNQLLPAFEPLVEILTKPATWNSDNFKTGSVGPWLMMLANDGAAAAEKMLTSLKGVLPPEVAIPNPKDGSYKILEKTADMAKVEVINGTQKAVVTFKKTGGYWISNITEQGIAQIATAKSYLENLDQAGIDSLQSNVRTGLTTANTVLGSLAKAKTQQEFNTFVEPFVNLFIQGFQAQMARQGGMPGAAGGQRKGPMGMGIGGMGPPQPTQTSTP